MAKGRGDDSEDDDLDEELLQLTEKKSNKRNKSIESSDEDYEEKSSKKKKTAGPGRKKGSSVQSTTSTINYGGNRRNRGSTITENYGDFDDGLDSELYKDDQDRHELSLLPEVERENILSERYEKRKEARERWLSAKEKEKENKSSSSSSSSSSTTTTTTTSTSSSKTAISSTRGRVTNDTKEEKQKEALKDIARKREKSLANKKDKDEEEQAQHQQQQQSTPTLSSSSTPKTSSSSKMDQQYRHDRERENEKRENENKIQDKIAESIESININLMNQCRLSRNMLVKWMDQPYFETLAPKFFVRVVIGQHLNNPIYRIAEIVSVCTGHKLYKVENKETDKLLRLSYAGSEKEFGIENVSNNIITPTEHEKWISDMVRANKKLPLPSDIESKIADIKKAQDYIYTDEDIERRALERIKYQKVPVNIAIEKAKLIALRETFEPNSIDYQNVCERIEELNKATASQKVENTTKVDHLISTINKKNKSLNFKYQQSTSSTTEQVSNEFDPFARRKTRNCAVVAADSSSIINANAAASNSTTTDSPINAALSPTSQHFEKQSKLSSPSTPPPSSSKHSNQSDNLSNRSLYDIHKSIDLNIYIPDQPKEVLSIQPKKKRQIIPATIIKNDHSMFKNILSFDEYLTKRNSMVQ